MFEFADGALPPVMDLPHLVPDRSGQCPNVRCDRVWSPPSIGRVPGAGGSPAR
jgi:hypothetical protein